MLQLTCNNDHDTLKAVLEYGKEKFEPLWETEPPKEEEDETSREKQGCVGCCTTTKSEGIEMDPVQEENKKKKKEDHRKKKELHQKMVKEGRKQNPIMISSQNNYDICTQLLFSAGYRIPQNKLERERDMGETEEDKILEGFKEKSRQKIVMALPNQDDAVEKLLLYKAYSNPQYLSMALSNDKSIEDLSMAQTNDSRDQEEKNEKDKKILRDLQRIDPLRRAFDLAEEAEKLSNNIQGFSELKSSYKEIQEELEGFTQSILTQCSNMDEVRSILEHNPEDWDDDDDDSEEQNWQVAVWEGRKEFVAHPFFQQYIKKRMDVCSKILGKKLSDKISVCIKSDILLNLICMPLALLVFCLFPFIVLADFFREADILFVSPTVWQKREEDKIREKPQQERGKIEKIEEKLPFRFFRRAMHTKTLSMMVAHVLHALYIVLLGYIVVAPKYNKVEPQLYTFCLTQEYNIYLEYDNFLLGGGD